jgi:hypothetical protein
MSTQNRTPSWPGEQLCNSCFYTAMRTYGTCPICGHHGVLPGRANRTDHRPVCLACAGIPENYQCPVPRTSITAGKSMFSGWRRRPRGQNVDDLIKAMRTAIELAEEMPEALPC